jgi:transposase
MTTRPGLRKLSAAEARRLREKVRDYSLSARIHQRYRIIADLRAGHTPSVVADRVGCHFTVVYDWMHRFNTSGFKTFELAPNPKGRPPILRAEQLRALVEVALSSPEERGLPFTVWSVPKLAAYCRDQHLLPPVTDEWVRRLLRRDGITAQRVRTWKTSTDPEFEQKKTASAGSTAAARRARR